MSEHQSRLDAVVTGAGTGASFALWDGEQLHVAIAGRRNSRTDDPVTPDTLMHIGSVTKVMNAVLVMQLVDDGLISLEDRLLHHLPELRLRDMRALQRMTCGMLLNHTSGIDGAMLKDYGPDLERIVDAVGRFADLPQLHAPGAGPSYCNVGAVIAGYLVQKLRGASWYLLMRQRIFEPLQLAHAVASPIDLPRFRVACGDLTDPASGNKVQTRTPIHSPSFAPAGATTFMTATDLVTFGRALMNGGVGPSGARILSQQSAARMLAPTSRILQPAGWHWGIGWMLLPGDLAFHSGSAIGNSAALYCHVPSGRVLALLVNSDRFAEVGAKFLEPILRHWTDTVPNEARLLARAVDAEPYAGSYENLVMRAEVISHAQSLAIRLLPKISLPGHRPPEPTEIPLQALDDGSFRAAVPHPALRGDIRFADPAPDGRMRSLGVYLHLLARCEGA